MQGAWWRHDMEMFSAAQGLCDGNAPANGVFWSQRDNDVRFYHMFYTYYWYHVISGAKFRLY